MSEIKYFVIKAFGGTNHPLNLFYYSEKNELYVSPTGRLCGPACAQIADLATAERFCEALMPKFQAKYGPSFQLEVLSASEISNRTEKTREKIQKDTARVKDCLKKLEHK